MVDFKALVSVVRSAAKPSLCLLVVVVGLLQCQLTPSTPYDRIQQLERQAFVGDSLREDVRRELMVAYADLARTQQDHPFVPEALFRRADLLVSAERYEQAILQLQDLHDGYPNYPLRARCAFLVAFIHEVHLRDPELAKRAYERVQVLHPGTPEAEMAAQSLALLASRP